MFTEKEIQLTREIFTKQQFSLMQPNAVELVTLAQSVVQKMTENKDGEQCIRIQERGSDGDNQ